MRASRLVLIVVGVIVGALVVSACGDEEPETTSTPAEQLEDAGEVSEGAAAPDEDGAVADADAVYDACIEAVTGSAAEDAAIMTCEVARDAFESCASRADSLDEPARTESMEICRDAADQVIGTAEAAAAGGRGY